MKNKKFNKRAFISLYMGVSFLIMSISGIILFIAPPGRIANWSYLPILGLTKSEWQAIHTIFTFLFIFAGIFHLVFNWKPMLNYFRTKTSGIKKIRKEMLAVFVVSLFLFVSAYHALPPFSYVLEFGDDVTNSWSMPNNQIRTTGTEKLTVGETNIIIPNDTRNLMKEKEDAADNRKHRNSQQGKGLGRKLMSDVFVENNYNWSEGCAILKNNGILLESDGRLKDIAVANNITPSVIIKMIQIN